MAHEHFRRVLETLEAGTADARALSAHSITRAAAHLRLAIDQALQHLEQHEAEAEDDVISRLDRQAQDIADDLRRAERLMQQRTGRE